MKHDWKYEGRNEIGWETFICRRCNLTLMNCSSLPSKEVLSGRDDCGVERDRLAPPSITEKISRFARAVVRWKAAGSPTRSGEEIQRIYDECCRSCRKFSSEKGTCLHCGCRVAKSGTAFRNKIAMATEHCPLTKW